MVKAIPEDVAPYLTSTEVAQLLGVSRACVVRWIDEQRLDAGRDGTRWMIPAESVREFARHWDPDPRAGAGTRRASHEGPAAIWDTLAALVELGPSQTWELATALDRHTGNVRKYLLILRRRGFVTTSSTGVYTITPAGRQHLRKEVSVAS